MKSKAALAACLVAGFYYCEDLGAQPLTAEEVAGPIKTHFEPAASQCAAGKALPPLVKIEVLIQKDGSASMISSSPALDPDVEACVKTAMEKVKFRASGMAFKAVYSFKPAPPEAAPAVQPVPPVEPAQTTQPAAPAATVSPASPTPTAPAAAQTAPPVQPPGAPPPAAVSVAPLEGAVVKPPVDQDLYRRVRVSRGVMIGGFAAFGAMWISMIITSAVFWVGDICFLPEDPADCPEAEGDQINAGALAPIIGPFWSAKDLLDAGYRGAGAWYIINPILQIAFLTVGIAGLALMVTSHRRMNQKQSVYGVTFLPLVTKSPGKGQVVGGMLAGYF